MAERGITELKFFPAEAAGGAPYLASVASPLPQLRFCPTGGITAASARRYLDLPNVGCVGGSWVTPADALAAGDWARITRLAAERRRVVEPGSTHDGPSPARRAVVVRARDEHQGCPTVGR